MYAQPAQQLLHSLQTHVDLTLFITRVTLGRSVCVNPVIYLLAWPVAGSFSRREANCWYRQTHGNFEDLERLAAVFTQLLDHDPDSHWAILGDAVHGSSDKDASIQP